MLLDSHNRSSTRVLGFKVLGFKGLGVGNKLIFHIYLSCITRVLVVWVSWILLLWKQHVFFLLHGQAGDDKRVLAWRIRYRVALGVAEALDYLQNGCRRPVIHRDVKPSNVLLTENFEPRVNVSYMSLLIDWLTHLLLDIWVCTYVQPVIGPTHLRSLLSIEHRKHEKTAICYVLLLDAASYSCRGSWISLTPKMRLNPKP
jgi:hypothetical protein